MACCCSAAVVACGTSSPPPAPVPSTASKRAQLPRFNEVWDEEFAAHVTLERLQLRDTVVLVPEGLRLPAEVHVAANTEATLLLADDPSRIEQAVSESLASAGYEVVADDAETKVWTGKGMAIRLELHEEAQLLAWAPEAQLGDLVPTN